MSIYLSRQQLMNMTHAEVREALGLQTKKPGEPEEPLDDSPWFEVIIDEEGTRSERGCTDFI